MSLCLFNTSPNRVKDIILHDVISRFDNIQYHMTVGMSHDCLHLIGSDRILSLCHLFLPDVTVSVADPGLSVGGIKQRVQKGVGAGGGNAPSRFS